MDNINTFATIEQLENVAGSLQSGKFLQTQGVLRKNLALSGAPVEFGYCCLGVCKEVCQIESVPWRGGRYSRDSTFLEAFNSEEYTDEYIFLPISVQKFLSNLNDNGFKFDKIADVFLRIARMRRSEKSWEEISQRFENAVDLLG